MFLLCIVVLPVIGLCGESSGSRIVTGESSLVSCRCPDKAFPCAAVERAVRRRERATVQTAVRNFLDSLGYFQARWDTLQEKIHQVKPGSRAVVCGEAITGTAAVTLDSLPRVRFPRWYDAGEIKERVAGIARCLAERGYPYAAVAVSIHPFSGVSSKPDRSSRDSLRITYRVSPDLPCVFAAPRIFGAHSTGMQVLLRDVQVRHGGIFDVRKIEGTVYRLGMRPYIASAAAGAIKALPDAMRPANDSNVPAHAEYVVVPFLLKDRSGLGVEGALGFNSREGDPLLLQGTLTLSFQNLFHSGESASLLYAGDRTYQKFHVEAAKPWLFGLPLAGSASFGLEIHESRYGFLTGEAKALFEIQKRWNMGMSIKGSETATDSSGASWHFIGADFLLSSLRERLEDGLFSREFSLAAGGGIADREQRYARSHADFLAGIHAPLWRHQAFRLRLVSKHLITREEMLVDAEMYRTGGYRSVRGYQDNEFAFRTVAYQQCEYLRYFSASGSAYIFMDGGFGFERSLNLVRWSERREFMGYGLGTRIPTQRGTLRLEWARNIDDRKSFGRVHVMIQNTLAEAWE